MIPATTLGPAYIVAARRTALGRPGGLHKARRLETLVTPVVLAALEDVGIGAEDVDQIILGNTTAGGNPARLIGLSAGLRESVSALTVDRQCASGLDAILFGARAVAMGEADIVVAGGGESISTAPWRIAKPKSVFQTPRFLGLETDGATTQATPAVAASETLARRLGISRGRQDAYALRSHLKAERARDRRGFVGEIVPLRVASEEARDETAGLSEMDELAQLELLMPPDGTHTLGNTSAPQDGAAIAVIVSGQVYEDLGSPRAIRFIASTTQGMRAGEEARAPLMALERLLQSCANCKPLKLDLVEMSETSAAQALALSDALGLDEAILSPDGGALARGHPLGAASAVSLVRLFTHMARENSGYRPQIGAVTQGAVGGLGVAALFEAV